MITVATHNGDFHADDVFAIAAFQLLFGKENVQVIRTRDDAVLAEAEYVVDVGGVYDHTRKRYDHHQPGAPVRDNGIPYAGFGLVWKHYGEALCGSVEVAEEIERMLVWSVDARDNAVHLFPKHELGIPSTEWDSILKTWRAEPDSDEDMDEQFLAAATVVRTYLERLIRKEQRKVVEKAAALALYEAANDKTILVSDVPLSRQWFTGYEYETKVVVSPRDDTPEADWFAVAVQKTDDDFATKVRFPEAWAGLRDAELQTASGLNDAVFCHRDRYLFVAKSKESAMVAAKLTK